MPGPGAGAGPKVTAPLQGLPPPGHTRRCGLHVVMVAIATARRDTNGHPNRDRDYNLCEKAMKKVASC